MNRSCRNETADVMKHRCVKVLVATAKKFVPSVIPQERKPSFENELCTAYADASFLVTLFPDVEESVTRRLLPRPVSFRISFPVKPHF